MLIGAPRTDAHELQPTIADMSVTDDGALTLLFRINLEAFLSGADLDGLSDTDAAEAAAGYDALRAQSGEEIAERVDEIIALWNAQALVIANADPLEFELENVSVPEGIDFELPRLSALTIQATLPDAAKTVIVNWPQGSGAIVVRQQGVDAPFTGYLDGGQSSEPIPITGGNIQIGTETFLNYIPVGFDHILPKGLDHILFVLGLFFLSTRWGPLLWQISAFTLAHTITLGLGALGWVSIPGSIVEPLIAASIVYVAVENLFMRGLSRWRPLVVFIFGLLHGLGFASVLSEFGLPQGQFIPALIGFNVGVELGQVTVILTAALLLWGCARLARMSELSPQEEPVGEYAVMYRSVSIPASVLAAPTRGAA